MTHESKHHRENSLAIMLILMRSMTTSRHARSNWYPGWSRSSGGRWRRSDPAWRPYSHRRIGVECLNNDFSWTDIWRVASALLVVVSRWIICRIVGGQIIVGSVESGVWSWNKTILWQRINANLHLAEQVKTTQHRFGPPSVAYSLSFMAVYTDLQPREIKSN